MSDFKKLDRLKFEELLNMESGYVLNFSNSSLNRFVADSVNIDIYDNKYWIAGNSKANRLRELIRIESNQIVGNLLFDLVVYWKSLADKRDRDSFYRHKVFENNKLLYEDCLTISHNMKDNSVITNAEIFSQMAEEEDFEKISNNINNYIKDGKYNEALDRLHTFMMKFSRALCSNHEIEYSKDESLHSVFGKLLTSNS